MPVDKKPKDSAFRQQRLKAWQPILTPKPVITAFFLVGAIFIIIGVIILTSSHAVWEKDFIYYDPANTSSPCKQGEGVAEPDCGISFTVDKDVPGPVYFYYRLTNFYQNHRLYVKSRNDAQLAGGTGLTYTDLSTCDPDISPDPNASGTDANVWLPCGLIASSMFNDSFVLNMVNTTINTTTAVNWTNDGIAWKSDLAAKFINPAEPQNGTWIPQLANTSTQTTQGYETPEFVVWMRTAGLPDFKKLNRIILNGLAKGTYQISIQNIFPVWQFNGTKHVVFSTTSWIGGKNDFLAWAYIVVGIICIIQAVLFLVRHVITPRKLGDPKYLDFGNK